jgi:hypothetical protein
VQSYSLECQGTPWQTNTAHVPRILTPFYPLLESLSRRSQRLQPIELSVILILVSIWLKSTLAPNVISLKPAKSSLLMLTVELSMVSLFQTIWTPR